MEWIAYCFIGLVVIGVSLTLFEARRKRSLISDERLANEAKTELDRDIERAGDDFNSSSLR